MAHPGGDDLPAWEAQLDAAEAALRERELLALEGAPTQAEVDAFTTERERLAADRDAVADAYDEYGHLRDEDGLERDVAASRRDQSAREHDPSAERAEVDRLSAGIDRDSAAGDRSDSGDDRRRSALARQQAAADRQAARGHAEAGRLEIAQLTEALDRGNRIGQAQGVVMAKYNVTAAEALQFLDRLARETNSDLRDVAAAIVAGHDSGAQGPPDDDSSGDDATNTEHPVGEDRAADNEDHNPPG